MKDKRLLFFMVCLAVYLFLVSSDTPGINDLVSTYSRYKKLLAEEKELINKSDNVSNYLDSLLNQHNENIKLFFDGNTDPSTHMNNMQSFINKHAKQLNVEVVNLRWGEASIDGNFVIMPINFVFRGDPLSIYKLVTLLETYEKLVTVDQFRINRQQDYVQIMASVSLYAYKK